MLWRLIFCLLLTSARGTSTYAYDAVGNLDHVIDPNGLAHAYRYTEQNRLRLLELTNVSGTLIQSYTYALNRSGMRTGVTESNLVSGTAVVRRSASYEYDQNYASGAAPARVYRLTRENLFNGSGSAAGVITHVYDLVGNRTSRTTTGLTPVDAMPDQTGLTFNARDLIAGTYDANGNSTAYETGTTTGDVYDAENRLIARSTTITVGYDSDGNRVKKTVSGATTYYLVDEMNPTGYAQVIAEWSNTGNPPDRAYTPGSELIAQRRNTGSASSPVWTVSYYGYDGLGSIRLLTDTSTTPTVTDTYDYDAYGQLLASSGTTPNAYRYTGQQWDTDLGMYYLRSRYYQPNQGRFWTMDTFEGAQEDPLSLHKYLYVWDNPVNHIDPSGHDLGEVLVVAGIGATIGGLSSAVANVAEGRAITAKSVFEGAALGAVLGPFAAYIPAVGAGLGIGGAVYSGLSYGPILADPNATFEQREASAVLIFSSIYGATAGLKYGAISKNGTANNCFTAGTLVLESDGYKPIEEVKEGDTVWSWNQEQNDLVLEPVQQLFRRTVNQLVVVNFGTNQLETTMGHPFWVEGLGWVAASNLRPGEALTTFDGGIEKITSVRVESTPATVFNFEVKDTHTYFVTGDAVLVHNACANDLAANLEAVGESRPPGSAAHHIVSRNDVRAAQARAILQREKIDPDDAANGAFLSTPQHRGLHTDLYYETLNHELEGALPGTVRARLLIIGQELKSGTYPY